jgi:hypothetical protein
MRVRNVQQRGQRPDAVGGDAVPFGGWRSGSAWLLLIVLVAAPGCRSGVRSLSAPKWPNFSGAKSKSVEAPALASVPTSDAPIKKPSAAAVPYPTTSTPAGYVVNDPATASGGAPEGIQTAATDPAMVTYGVTPPLPVTPAYEPAAPARTLAESTPPAPISPQVGPYATLPPPPAAAETPTAPGIPSGPSAFEQAALPAAGGLSAPPGGGYPVATPAQAAPTAFGGAPPAPTAFPATAGYEPAARVADSAGFGPAAGGAAGGAIPAAAAPAALETTPSLAPIVDPAAGVAARYAAVGSRYGGAETSPPAAPVVPLQETFPAATVPAAVPPPPGPLPAANPDGLTSPPVRRPDPVFRPGGTSSYRPAEQIFVDETPVAPATVRTASYEVTDPPPPPPAGLR